MVSLGQVGLRYDVLTGKCAETRVGPIVRLGGIATWGDDYWKKEKGKIEGIGVGGIDSMNTPKTGSEEGAERRRIGGDWVLAENRDEQ